MNYIWNTYDTATWVVTLVLLVLLFAFIFYTYIKIIKRVAAIVSLSICAISIILTFLLNLNYAFIFACSITVVSLSVVIFTNLGDFRAFLANPFKVSKGRVGKPVVEKLFNREELYNSIEKTVVKLSKEKTGAIITLEKSTSLNDLIKNGVPVKAPVTSELLETIFYPGTRLHDGAVIIKNNMILSASVIFTPTTKPFADKYGARHRAALGISEVTDSVTIVVSEETGRISFAVNGQLESVTPEKFKRVLENYMDGFNE